MKIRTNRRENIIDTDYLVVFIGEDMFRITESIDGKINILKTSDESNQEIMVFPRSSNVIEVK